MSVLLSWLTRNIHSGLGFGYCERLIDEFLSSSGRDPTSHLVLIITTRSPLKTRLTIARLRDHLRDCAEDSAWAKASKKSSKTYDWKEQVARIHFLGLELDLCNLRQVYEAARKIKGNDGGLGSPDLLTSEGRPRYDGKGKGLRNIQIPRLDVFVMNAGIGGWTGMDWPLAVWTVLTGMPESVTWPAFKLAQVGATVKDQAAYSNKKVGNTDSDSTQNLLNGNGHAFSHEIEPVLGEVFCANLFGHYILGHELMPLLSSNEGRADGQKGRLLFISSIEARAHHLNEDDFQGLESKGPYESSKRLTDILALTSHLPSVQKVNKPYFSVPSTNSTKKASAKAEENSESRPEIYLAHPGICATDIVSMHAFLLFCMRIAFYIARLVLGSVWHPITAYKGAVALVWLTLAEQRMLDKREGRDGEEGASERKVKWGSSSDRWGNERVRRTEVQGWGMSGLVGEEVEALGRKKGSVDVGKEEREEFEALGVRCWREMERMRAEWEERLGVGRD